MALLDCLVALGGNQAVSYLVTGKSPPRMGNEHQSLVPYQVFATSDGHVIIAVGNDQQWQRYCEAIEEAGSCQVGEVAEDDATRRWPRGADPRSREDHADTDDCRCGWNASRPGRALLAPSTTTTQVFKDPHVKHRKLLIEQTRSDGVKIPGVASPCVFRVRP